MIAALGSDMPERYERKSVRRAASRKRCGSMAGFGSNLIYLSAGTANRMRAYLERQPGDPAREPTLAFSVGAFADALFRNLSGCEHQTAHAGQ